MGNSRAKSLLSAASLLLERLSQALCIFYTGTNDDRFRHDFFTVPRTLHLFLQRWYFSIFPSLAICRFKNFCSRTVKEFISFFVFWFAFFFKGFYFIQEPCSVCFLFLFLFCFFFLVKMFFILLLITSQEFRLQE